MSHEYRPLDHGRTHYTVTLAFSDDYPSRDGAESDSNPLNWNWASLVDQPDARVLSVVERPNPDWRPLPEPPTMADVLRHQADRMKAERDALRTMLEAVGVTITPEGGGVWLFGEGVQA